MNSYKNISKIYNVTFIIWNFSFLKTRKKFKKFTWNLKNQLIHLKWKIKDELLDFLIENYFSTLLIWKINFFEIFDVDDFFNIFIMYRNIEIPVDSNFCLRLYM